MHWQSLKAGQVLDFGFRTHISLWLRSLCRIADQAYLAVDYTPPLARRQYYSYN